MCEYYPDLGKFPRHPMNGSRLSYTYCGESCAKRNIGDFRGSASLRARRPGGQGIARPWSLDILSPWGMTCGACAAARFYRRFPWEKTAVAERHWILARHASAWNTPPISNSSRRDDGKRRGRYFSLCESAVPSGRKNSGGYHQTLACPANIRGRSATGGRSSQPGLSDFNPCRIVSAPQPQSNSPLVDPI